MKAESEEPEDDQDDDEGIKHMGCVLSLFAAGDGDACKTFLSALLFLSFRVLGSGLA